MIDKFILPLCKSNIRSFPQFAFADALISSNMGNRYNEYLSGKFINFYFDLKSLIFALVADDNWGVDAGIVSHQKIELYKTSFAACGINIIDIFKKGLQSDLYIYGLRGREQNKYLVNGYDDTINAFQVWSSDSEKGLFSEWIAYEDLINSLFEVPGKTLGITFWKYNKKHSYALDIRNVAVGICEYLEGVSRDKNRICGLLAFKELSFYCVKQAKSQELLDKRFLLGFVEHKYFMYERIKYLVKKDLMSKTFLQSAQAIVDIATSVENMVDTYNATKKPEYAVKISKIIERTISLEQRYLPSALIELEDKMDRLNNAQIS